MTNILLDAKAVMDDVDNRGRQPIDYAIEKGSAGMIFALFKAEEPSTIHFSGCELSHLRRNMHLAAYNVLSDFGLSADFLFNHGRSIISVFKASSPEYALALLRIG